jgi:hypothetical protein
MVPQRTDWHLLAEQASKEMDREKLMSLVDELDRALEANERASNWPRTPESI